MTDYTKLGQDWDAQGLSENFSDAEIYGEVVNVTPIKTAKEELRHRLVETIESRQTDEYRAEVMNAVRQLMELK